MAQDYRANTFGFLPKNLSLGKGLERTRTVPLWWRDRIARPPNVKMSAPSLSRNRQRSKTPLISRSASGTSGKSREIRRYSWAKWPSCVGRYFKSGFSSAKLYTNLLAGALPLLAWERPGAPALHAARTILCRPIPFVPREKGSLRRSFTWNVMSHRGIRTAISHGRDVISSVRISSSSS